MGNVIETLVTEVQSDEAERRPLLSDSQFGGRNNRSAIDAAAIMVDRADSLLKKDNVTLALLMDIKAAFRNVSRGRLNHALTAKYTDGDLIRRTESILSERTVEMVIEGNVLHSHHVEAGVLQGSPASPILSAIDTAGLRKWVEERVEAGGLSFADNLGCVANRKNVNRVVEKLEACVAESIVWASRRDLQFNTAKTEAALFTHWRDHKKHLRLKLTAKIKVGNGFVQFNQDATQ